MPTSIRASVIVDGISLTRQQVEQAMRELEKPVEPTSLERVQALKAGDRFVLCNKPESSTYLVMSDKRFVNIKHGTYWAISDDGLARDVEAGLVEINGRR